MLSGKIRKREENRDWRGKRKKVIRYIFKNLFTLLLLMAILQISNYSTSDLGQGALLSYENKLS